MEFSVRFLGEGGSMAAYGEINIGIELLDKARVKFPALTAVNLTRKDSYISENPFFKLTEREARETGLYLKCTHINVLVPKGFLSEYFHLDFFMNEDSDPEVMADFCVHKEEVFTAWRLAGFPEDWGT